MWLCSNVINIMYSVSVFQSFLYNSNSHKGYTCICIVTSIGWSICMLTGTTFVSKSMPLALILLFKMLNFRGNLASMSYVDNNCLQLEEINISSITWSPGWFKFMKFSLRCVRKLSQNGKKWPFHRENFHRMLKPILGGYVTSKFRGENFRDW